MLPRILLLWGLMQIVQCQGNTELLRNADFEQPFGPSNWECSGCKTIATDKAHNGKQAFYASYRMKSYNGPGQSLDLTKVKPGRHYQFSSYVKLLPSAPLTQPQMLKVTLRHSFKNGGKSEYQSLAIIKDVKTNQWLDLAGDFVITDYQKPLTELYLYVEGPDPGVNIVIDQSSLKEVGISKKWKEEAEKRIESIRKGGLTVSLDSDSLLRNVTVKIEQLKHEFGFGTAVAASYLQENSAYKNWYLNNFEWAVLENAMKWRQIEWTSGKLKYSPADGAMKILKDNGKKVRGHAVFWAVPDRNPDWLKKITNKDQLYNVCMARATDIVSRYKGRLEHWDVNNEMMAGNFYEARYGSSKIRYDMFRKVKETDPSVMPFLNDYNVISGGQRLSRYISMAKEFIAAKVPLEGIGVQGHFHTRPVGPMLLSRLDRLAKVGLPIWVTELDYGNKDDQKRADGLEEALTAFFSHPSVDGVLFWGFYEGKHHRGAEAALVNGDQMTPNAAGKMWQRLFHKQWRTNLEKKVTLEPRKINKVFVKAFYGEYRVSVIGANGKLITSRNVTLKKSAGSKFIRIPLTQSVIG